MAARSALFDPPPPKDSLMATILTPRFFIMVAYWMAWMMAESGSVSPSLDARSAMIRA